jgi:hypothetical protein
MTDQEAAAFKSHLETLTTGELLTLADQSGIDIPPELDRLFVIRELLDNEYDEGLSEPLQERPELKTASLPRQYHITFLEVLPRDPRWVFVFWEIKAQEREHYESMSRFEGYALRITELKNGRASESGPPLKLESGSPLKLESFTIPVETGDNSWYVGFPPGGGMFRVELLVRGPGISLAVSRPFTLPRFLNDPGNEELLARPLVQLSGAADFAVLRNIDRVSRLRA